MSEPIVFEALGSGESSETYAEAEVALALRGIALSDFTVVGATDSGWATGSIRLRSTSTAWLGFAAPGGYAPGGEVVLRLQSIAFADVGVSGATDSGWASRSLGRLSSYAEGEQAGPVGGAITDGRGAMPRLRTFAVQAALATGATDDGWAIGRLPGLASFVLDDQLTLLPQDGQGEIAMPALSTVSTGHRGVISSDAEVVFRLASFSMEAALATGADEDGWAIGTLPPLFGAAMETAPTLDAFVLLLGPPAYLTGFADDTQGYIVDTLETEDTFIAQMVAALRALMDASTTTTSARDALAAISDLMQLNTQLRIALEAVTTDTAIATGASTGELLRVVAMRDALLASGTVTATRDAMVLLAEAMAITESLARLQEGEVTSNADFATLLQDLRFAATSVVEEAAADDTVLGLAMVTVLVPDEFDISANPLATALRLATVEDGLDIAVSYAFDGERYLGLSLNATTKGVAEYDNFPFDSLANFQGDLYGASEDGVYVLEGEDDDGAEINARIRTAMQRVAMGQAGSVTDAYLGFRGDGSLQLKVIVANARTAGAQKAYVFDLIHSPAGAPLPGRFKIGKGLKSVYMAFELSNTGGSDFAIDTMEVRPLVSNRRLP